LMVLAAPAFPLRPKQCRPVSSRSFFFTPF
jgi:hypothetical protein